MTTYDARNIVVKIGETVITGLGEAIVYRYPRGAVPYPVLETTAPGTQALITVPNEDDNLSFLKHAFIRCTGRRVPPKIWNPKDDEDLARAIFVASKLAPEINRGDEGAFMVARDAAADAGFMLEVISDGQAEADRLSSAKTPPIIWRTEGDNAARCGGLRFFHPNQGGPLSKWIMDRIARTWHGSPLYRYTRKDGQLTEKRRVWEPKVHDLFGQQPFSEKRQDHVDDARTELFCVVAGCTNHRTEDGLCLAHRDRPWEEGDSEW